MPDFKLMYYTLFNRITDAVNILQTAQLEAESAFMASDDEPILIPLTVAPNEPEDSNYK